MVANTLACTVASTSGVAVGGSAVATIACTVACKSGVGVAMGAEADVGVGVDGGSVAVAAPPAQAAASNNASANAQYARMCLIITSYISITWRIKSSIQVI